MIDLTTEEEDFLLSDAPDQDVFSKTLTAIAKELEDNPSLTPALRSLYTDVIYCLAMETRPIAEDAGIKKLAVLLKPLGVTLKAIRSEIKIARKSNPSLRGDRVTGTLQSGTGVSVQSVTGAVTPDQEKVTGDKLEEQAAAVLSADDPMELVQTQIKAIGYGGDLKSPLIVYLSFTSRLLKMRTGSMPVHLLLHGPASAGKSYTVKIVLLLLPSEAFHVVDAGSPRVIIYDPSPLRHRALIFGEADNIPSGEDNPAASAVRNLTQDNYLHYEVVTKDEFGSYYVRDITKEGPTVLITTATRELGDQLMTRLFILDVADDEKQVKAALETQARLEITGAGEVNTALIAYQSLLQAQAPWDVIVPFAEALATEIGRAASVPRILRDFQRVLSLIKSVAVLRHRHRQRDKQGRLVAEIEDYKTVFDLVAEMYAATTTGASKAVRKAVNGVQELKAEDPTRQITYTVLGKKLGAHRDMARRHANTAIRLGWLVNNETRPRHTADLDIGEEMPPDTGLPSPETLSLLSVTFCELGGDSESDKLTDAEILAAIGEEDSKYVLSCCLQRNCLESDHDHAIKKFCDHVFKTANIRCQKCVLSENNGLQKDAYDN